MIITAEFLKQHRAYYKVIKFFERNFPVSLFPEGLDLSKVEITGDYEPDIYIGYFERIKNILACKYEYNSEGNVIKRTFPSGYIEEYNNEGKVIKKVYLSGHTEEFIYSYKHNNNITEEYIYSCSYICKYKKKKNTTKKCKFSGISKNRYEYDQNNNLIKETCPNGYIKEWEYEYDNNKNIIKEITEGYTNEYKYDDRNNLIEKKFCRSGDIITFTFKYDEIGRLIQVNNCHIKYLDDTIKTLI